MISKNNKGITLVALVITIIILLILAGVTINMVLGDEGIIKKAQDAKQISENKEIEELADVNSLDWRIPVAAGTHKYIDKEVEGVPIPKGFEYKEGTKDEGLVIQDIEVDTKGKHNEFVWVPVTNIENFQILKNGWGNGKQQSWLGEEPKLKPNDGTLDSEEYLKEYESMLESVKRYNGFYVGRYETNYLYGSTKEEAPINNKTWYELYTGQKELYSEETDSVVSAMIYGHQWDAIMEWLSDVPNNYSSIIEDELKYYIRNSIGMGWFAGVRNNEEYLTGIDYEGVNNKVKNIYDLAGNMYEWTQEAFGNSSRVFRGGSYLNGASWVSASYRIDDGSVSDDTPRSSRLQLYIK